MKNHRVIDLHVRSGTTNDGTAQLLLDAWCGPDMVVHGRTFRLDRLATLVALHGEQIVGVLTYELRDDELEIVSCNSFRRRSGVGRALVGAVRDVASRAGVGRIVCTTTNDNIGALAFWQCMGLRLTAIRPGAVDEARQSKPSIPLVGDNGIEIHDELDLSATTDDVAR